MRTLDEVYEEARHCVAELRGAGFSHDADALDGAMYAATSGEILTYLGFHLSSILGSRPDLPVDLRERLETLLAGVSGILRDAGQG